MTLQESSLDIESAVKAALSRICREVAEADLASEPDLEPPKDWRFGDWSTSAALKLAKTAKKNPRALAEEIRTRLDASVGAGGTGLLQKITVDGPGFINLHLSREALAAVLGRIESQADRFGSSASSGLRYLVEYVSANPTGPLTIAHGRQAAFGDTLVRILSFAGMETESEYYNNDVGVQITILGLSFYERCREVSGLDWALPENGYRGDYLKTMAEKFVAARGKDWLNERETAVETCRLHARETILEDIRKDLAEFGVRFDRYFSQEALDRSGEVEKTLEELRRRGAVYESEGAVWLRSTDHGDDKDRVVVKSDRSYTYLMPDIAYHRNKLARGYDVCVNILGPDHHGYIARLKASQAALGNDPARIRVLIAQLVTLYEGDRQLRMSTRAGEFVTLRALMDEVGIDAARFFFLVRKCDSHLDFDLELAKKQSPDNPVFYIQYVNARVSSIRKNALEKGLEPRAQLADGNLLAEEDETEVLRKLWGFQRAVAAAARDLEPHILVEYLEDLARIFHPYYQKSRVMTDHPALSASRLALVAGVQQVVRNGLRLLGVSCPDSM